MEHSRSLGQQGTHIIFSPRASGPGSLAKWTAGGMLNTVFSSCTGFDLANFVDRPISSRNFGLF